MSMQLSSCKYCYSPLVGGECRTCVVDATSYRPVPFSTLPSAPPLYPTPHSHTAFTSGARAAPSPTAAATPAGGNTVSEQEAALRAFERKREQERRDAELAMRLAEEVEREATAPRAPPHGVSLGTATGTMPGLGGFRTGPEDTEDADRLFALRLQEAEEAEEAERRRVEQEEARARARARIEAEKERVRQDRALAESLRREEEAELEAERARARERARLAEREARRLAREEERRAREEAERLAREEREEAARWVLALSELDLSATEIEQVHGGPPPNWLCAGSGEARDGIFVVGKRTDEFRHVLARVRESMPAAFITKLERVQRPRLWRWFVLRQREVAEECGGAPDERRLFHGSRANAQHDIAREGFDQRLANANGALGAGVYFSDHASVSSTYARNKQLLLCRVTLGASTRGARGLKRPPEVQPTAYFPGGQRPRYYHSTTDGNHHFAVFENSLAYPEYLITLR